MAKDKFITLTLEGTPAMKQRLKNLSRATIQDAAIALNEEHELLMTVAKRRTPVMTGSLRASGHVQPVQITGHDVVSQGGFGGAAAPYALYVHENLNSRHPVGQAKFYESAFNEALRGMANRLAKHIKAMQ